MYMIPNERELPMGESSEESNDRLYQALMQHKKNCYSNEQSINGSILSMNEANLQRRTQANGAASVVTASTHYHSNAR
jgi:hypothetical protein